MADKEAKQKKIIVEKKFSLYVRINEYNDQMKATGKKKKKKMSKRNNERTKKKKTEK